VRILLIEDDPDLSELVVLGLRNAAYAADHASSCARARQLLASERYDVACVDLGLPDGDGMDLVRSLSSGPDRHQRPDRIVVLTARDAVEQRVAGLDAGADDYLVKPFAFGELLARIRAVSRRGDQADSRLMVGDLVLDTAALTVSRAGRPIDLTSREFSLLRYLARHAGEVVSAERLLEHVWDVNADPFTTSVRVLISRLRRKLGPPALIHTVTGAGYRLEPPP
jgi:DNA-binding response OmpR family regulator